MSLTLIDLAFIFGCMVGAFYLVIIAGQQGTVGDLLAKVVDNVIPRMGRKTPIAMYFKEGSPAFSFSWADAFEVIKHALFAGLAALITYLVTNWLPTVDQTTSAGILVFGIASVVLKALRQLIPNTGT